MQQTPLTNQLRRIRGQLRFRRGCRNAAVVLCGLGLSLCLLGIWEKLLILREASSAFCLGGIFLLSSLIMTWLGCCRLFRVAPLRHLALDIEQAHPEMLDRLICAVELENRSQDSLTGLENGLLEEMQRKYAAQENFFPEVFQKQYHLKKTLFLLALGFLLLLVASRLAFFRKAQYFLNDFLRGQESGILLSLSSNEFALHSDVRIEADITRWENEALIEIQAIGKSGGSHYRQNMHLQSGIRHAFTIYDLSENVRFRVITPSMKSSWHKLGVYTAPAVNAVQITTLPLEYTQHKVQTFNDFENFTLTAGEGFQLRLDLPHDVSAQLQQSAAEPKVVTLPKRIYPQKTSLFQVILTDSAGHQSHCQAFTVTIEADLPPVLELREPNRDCTIKPGDSLLLHVVAKDDFGISELALQFSVSGGKRQKLLLSPAEDHFAKELEHREVWVLDDLDLKDGDLLSCMVIATDNRTPNPQKARSDLFFVTVRPDANMLESEGDSPGEQQKLDISDLLAESKRLLRLTWDTLSDRQLLSAKELERQQFELLRDIKELEIEVRRRFNKLLEESMGLLAEPIPTLFQQSSQFLKAAAALLERELLEESVPAQELSLSALTRLENELLKNAMKSKGQQGDSEEQEGEESSDEQQAEQQQSQQEQAKKSLESMKESMTELESLLKRQQQINQDSANADKLPDELASRQENIRSDTKKTASKLEKVSASLSATDALQSSGAEMEKGRDAFEESDLRVGNLHGQRAHKELLLARRSLEAALRQASANQISRLAEQAAALSSAQRQAAEKTPSIKDTSQAKEAREQQKQLQEGTKKLSQEIQEISSMLEKDYPEASQSMRAASQQAEQRGLSRSQTRAGNALLYRQFEAAAKEQRDAANLLQALSQELQASAEKLPPMSSAELREMLQQLQQYADHLESTARQGSESKKRQQTQQIREQAAQTLQNAAEPLKDPRLQQITDNLRVPDGESSASEIGDKTMSLFKAAAAVLQEHLSRFLLEDKVNFSRESVAPPRKYKQQVEQYFKNLGNE